MLSKNQIKLINSLKLKKYRDEHGVFVAEGTKIIPELIGSSIKVKQIFATEGFIEEHTIPKNIELIQIKEQELERISFLSTPNQALAICEIPEYTMQTAQFEEKLTLVLDDIKDPGNLGTIIRIADWFGIDTIVCSNETADVYNPKVVQATMGSIARVKVIYTDLKDFLKHQSENKMAIYGAMLNGDNIYEQKKSNGIIVIGNESKGISKEIEQYISKKIKIPSFSHLKQNEGEAESLNAAIATAIICSEFRR